MTIRVEEASEPLGVILAFIDSGIPYNPLDKADPDVTLSAEEREIGGLGIFLVKKLMDEVNYQYSEGQNILTLRKTSELCHKKESLLKGWIRTWENTIRYGDN